MLTIGSIKENILHTINNIKYENDGESKMIGKRRVIEALKEFIFNRKVFNYGYLDIIQYLGWWVFWRRRISIKRNLKLRNQSYYRVGADKLEEELDWISVIKSIRKLKLISKVLLTNKQNFLMKFNRANVIDSTSSMSDDVQLNILEVIKGK